MTNNQLFSVFCLVFTTTLLIACGESSPYPGSGSDDSAASEIGTWQASIPAPAGNLYVRPPSDNYGTGDGSSWTNALSGLPESRVRGTRYFFAAGDYFDESRGRVENFILDDALDGEQFIWLVKATAQNHGSDEGFTEEMGNRPARLGPLSFISSRYIIDGQTGASMENYGFTIIHRNCAQRGESFIASPIFFPWNSETQYLQVSHVDIEDCGNQDDPTTRSQDAIYAVTGVSHIVFSNNYIHDSWRNQFFLQDAVDVLVQDNYFARAGLHHEANSLAFRNSRNVAIRRNYITDSVNCYVSLQGVRNVTISSNVLTRTLDDWDNWAGICSQEPALNVSIIGNTFFALEGLNTGIRFTGSTDNLLVQNNLWAANRSNQIMLNGCHSYNGFWDNQRINGDQLNPIDGNIEEETAQLFSENPFVESANFDFHLRQHTEPGVSNNLPFAQTDFDGNLRGDTPDRGAFQFVE